MSVDGIDHKKQQTNRVVTYQFTPDGVVQRFHAVRDIDAGEVRACVIRDN